MTTSKNEIYPEILKFLVNKRNYQHTFSVWEIVKSFPEFAEYDIREVFSQIELLKVFNLDKKYTYSKNGSSYKEYSFVNDSTASSSTSSQNPSDVDDNDDSCCGCGECSSASSYDSNTNINVKYSIKLEDIVTYLQNNIHAYYEFLNEGKVNLVQSRFSKKIKLSRDDWRAIMKEIVEEKLV